jgi:hypothetical protein
MKCVKNVVLGVALLMAAWLQPLHAQDSSEEEEEEHLINSNLGFVINVPVSSTSNIVHTGWGTDLGVGYNFDRRNAFIGEFMWNRVYANSSQLAPLSAVLTSPGTLNGTTDLFVISGNYRYELRGRLLGAYLIGGGGWYHRSNNLSQQITTTAGLTCNPTWLWWGFSCTGGTVNSNQALSGSDASAWGFNAGIGATVRVGDAPYRLYFESRYHYAPTSPVNIHFVQVTMGVRY